jgi:hypothetical protein
MDKKGYIVPYCLVMFFMKEHILQTDEKAILVGGLDIILLVRMSEYSPNVPDICSSWIYHIEPNVSFHWGYNVVVPMAYVGQGYHVVHPGSYTCHGVCSFQMHS